MIPTSLLPLANHLWQSTLFAGVAGLLAVALRKNRASVRYWLWFAASVKFLIPLALLVNVGSQIGWRATQKTVEQPRLTVVMDQITQPFMMPAPPPLLKNVPLPSGRVPAILFGIWLFGCTVSTFYWIGGWRRIRLVARGAFRLNVQLPGSSVRVMSCSAPLEPCVFGLRRPIVLLPNGIRERLTPDQLQVILAHELSHIRRHDNLTAAIHMVVETLFWFYPLVSWIGKRLMDEREHACDEEVLQGGQEPEVYAQGILNVCKFYLESSSVCAAGVTGSNLGRRIEAIMTNPIAYRMNVSRKLLLAVAGALVAVAPVLTGLVNARSQDAVRPTFEVATVKRNISGNPARFKMFPEVTVESTSLKDLIKFAYGVEDFRVSGGPAWIDADRYDIQARVEGNPGTFDLALQRQRLQTLLEDRFKLALHRETKELPIYALIVAKGGLKLQPLKEGDCIKRDITKLSEPLAPGQKPSDLCGYGGFGRGLYENTTATMVNVAGALSTLLGRMVIDKTGITSTFHVRLTFVPDETTIPMPGPVGTGDSNRPSSASDIGPNIFTALQEQLGLKLESAKGPVDVLVIDHVERPSEN